MDEYIKREDALDAVLFALVGTGLQSCAIHAIRDVPTADVVPKSEVENLIKVIDNTTKQFLELHDLYQSAKREVERLQAEIERLTINMNAYGLAAKRLAEEKAEVAREIFEEIEKWLVHEYVPYIRGYSNSLARNFAELKKEYTEGENNG